jgi:hypothetical protein
MHRSGSMITVAIATAAVSAVISATNTDVGSGSNSFRHGADAGVSDENALG